ncbi:heparanase-like [Saccoglossus kowalevskii]|uniref:Heparanase-like n=1 Tax=Saccoglossus kowalevskii TaxID=10224 RepID=A0ABM0MBX2_SACKO|nr:PREDICTED: heparanase-like [Saccoglossus kowalevskii]
MANNVVRSYVISAVTIVTIHACLRFDRIQATDVIRPSVKLSPNLFENKTNTNTKTRSTVVYNKVDVSTDVSLTTVSDKFLSVAIDAFMIRNHWVYHELNFSSPRLLTLARGLKPCHLRVSGTAADFLYFNESVPPPSDAKYEDGGPFTMTVDDWDVINEFANKVGWSMIFGLNVLIRKGDEWDPTNAIKLFNYTLEKGYKVNWELGNEPNLFPHKANITVEPAQLAKDFIALRNYLNSRKELRSDLLFGPDVTKPSASSELSGSLEYLRGFLKRIGDATNSTTFHQYYLCSKPPTPESFTDVGNLNVFVKQVEEMRDAVRQYLPERRNIWLGETGTSCSKGASDLSKTYVAGFMWMDKLGIAAKYGLPVVIRQTFIGGGQGLIDEDIIPRPDYWLSVLYKRLVGQRVLSIKLSKQNDGNTLRAYAHCTNINGTTYPSGSVTVYMLSVNNNQSTIVSLSAGSLRLGVDQYLLTYPPAEGVTSSHVELNGKKLKMMDDHTLPDFPPQTIAAGSPINMPPLSFGFYVIPGAMADACM